MYHRLSSTGWLMLILFTLPLFSAAQDTKQYKIAVVGFYNLENLFDTVNDPNKNDEEFLPEGKNRWNSDKYLPKLKNMSEVIATLGKEFNPDGMAILGISEIENKKVVEDLVAQPALKDMHFSIVHDDSPDRRGVDVGMIYQEKYFRVTHTASHRLVIPGMDHFYTRNQLVVTGLLLGEEVTVVVNHWPSRSGGEKRSRPLRNAAGDLTRHICDSLLSINPDANIIVLGDLNDNPNNESVAVRLGGQEDIADVTAETLYNPMYKLYKKGIGSTAYRDSWSLFDQILLSHHLVDGNFSHLNYYKTLINNKAFLQQKDGRYKGYPYRSFAGGAWLGGYSDHFPVMVVLAKEVQ